MKSRDITLSSLFGLIIFFQKFLLPAPYDKFVTLFLQIILLCLVYFSTGVIGLIFTSLISGSLTAIMRGGLSLMTFTVALLYGVLVSSFNLLFRVMEAGPIRRKRLMASALISTLITGASSATIAISLGLMPYNLLLFSALLFFGGLQGLVGGYLSSIFWERYFHNF